MSDEKSSLHSQITRHFSALKIGSDVQEIKIDTAEINKKNSNGEIPLHLVVKNKPSTTSETYELVSEQKREEKIKENGRIQIKNKKILQKQLELIEQLKTSDLTIQNYKNQNQLQLHQTPLHIAASHPNKEILEKILEVFPQEKIKNAAVLQDQDGNTPLHLAIKHYAKPEDIKKLFVGKYDGTGLDNLNLVDSKGNTPLHIAVENSNAVIAESLIQAGADVDVQDSKGNTPLHIAVEKGNKKLVELLIQAGADVNVKDSKGNTPLDLAITNGNAAIAIELYKHGAKPVKQKIESCGTLNRYVSAQKKFENFNTKILFADGALALVLGSFILTKEFSKIFENQDILDAVAPVENMMGNLGAAELGLLGLMGTSILMAIISYCWKNQEQSAAIQQAETSTPKIS